jgi:hypothetical protein
MQTCVGLMAVCAASAAAFQAVPMIVNAPTVRGVSSSSLQLLAQVPPRSVNQPVCCRVSATARLIMRMICLMCRRRTVVMVQGAGASSHRQLQRRSPRFWCPASQPPIPRANSRPRSVARLRGAELCAAPLYVPGTGTRG